MTQNLCSLRLVLDACEQPVWSAESQITLVVSKAISLSALRDLEQFEINPTFCNHQLQRKFSDGQDAELQPRQSFTLNLPRIIQRNVVVENLAALLAVDSATVQLPPAYFLIREEESGEPFCFTEGSSLGEAPTLVARYHQAIEFWNLIKSQVDFESNDTLLLFGLRRIEIRPGFRVSDLTREIAVDKVSTFINESQKPESQKPEFQKPESEKPDSEKHKIRDVFRSVFSWFLRDQSPQDAFSKKRDSEKPGSEKHRIRREIFRSVLSEFLSDQSPQDAFTYLLRKSDLFAQRLSEGWNIYIFNLSPKKLNQQAVTKHLELTEKLEKIIGGMETKSLTIPAAVLLAVKEVQFGAHWTTLNTIILAASVLYLLAMTVAHFSQRSTLKLLEKTITKTTSDLEDQGLARENLILTDSFVNLESRRRNSSYGSWAMFIFSFVPLIAVIYAAFFASPRP